VIDLPTIQRYLNFHFSVTMDLFGADVSSNAATFYTTGLKGRYEEDQAARTTMCSTTPELPVLEVADGKLQEKACRCSTPSTRSCATTTSPTPRPASSAGTRSSRRPASPSS
jgi:hypothetical protein